jgi:hypothetical protein
MSRPRAFAGLLSALLTLLVAGCRNDSDLCPAEPMGIVEGTVTGAGRPVRAAVKCAPTDAPGHESPNFETVTDSLGRYSLTVPAGDYLISVLGRYLWWSSRGVVWDEAEAETVHVGRGAVRADFAGSALTVRLAVPPGAEATAFDVCLHEAGGDRARLGYSSAGQVRDGFATLHWTLLPAGEYTLTAGADSRTMFWLPTSLDAADADRITVPPGERVTVTYRLPRPAVVDVRVHGSWQGLGPDAIRGVPWVEFFTPDSVGLAGSGVQPDGSYRAEFYAPADLRLQVTIGSIQRWLGGWRFDEAELLRISPGDPPRAIDYEESGIAVTLEGPGLLIDEHARYRLHDATGRRVATEWNPPVDRPAALANLSAGSYYLFVDHEDHGQTWIPQWYEGVDSLSSATPIVVPPGGGVTPIRVRLSEGGRILGRVHWSGGAPYVGWVRLRTPDGRYDDDQAGSTSGQTGRFFVVGLRDGEYLVGIPRGNRTLWHPGTWDLQAARAVRIVDHGIVEGIDLWIPE